MSTARAKRLQYFTIGYNVAEAAVALSAGMASGSISLFSFGLDSLIEVSASGFALGRLHGKIGERSAQRAIAFSLGALALWTFWESLEKILMGVSSERSLAGLLIAIASVLVMPWLAREKRKAAAALNSGALLGEAKQTDFCFFLSVVLLGSMAAQWLLGWNQVDAVGGLLMSPILIAEARKTWLGESCCQGGSCHA